MYSRYTSLIRSMIWKYLLPSCGLSLNLPDRVLCIMKVFVYDDVQLNFWWSFSVFSFVACAFGVISKKLLPNVRSHIFTPMFSSKNFMVLAFMFRSLYYCTLITTYDLRKGLNFILLRVDTQLSQQHLLKRLFFPDWKAWHSYQEAVDCRYVSLFLGSQFSSMPME